MTDPANKSNKIAKFITNKILANRGFLSTRVPQSEKVSEPKKNKPVKTEKTSEPDAVAKIKNTKTPSEHSKPITPNLLGLSFFKKENL